LHSNPGSVPEADRKMSTQPASIFLNRYALIIALILLLLSAWAGQTAIVILLGLGLAAAGLSQLWSHFALKGVRCERQLSERRLFPGEYLELKLRLINRKLLPLPWVQISDEVPVGFVVKDATPQATRPGFALISKNTSILWYSAVSWNYRLTCPHRGYFPLGPLTITSGDIFGFYPRRVTEIGTDYIIVYPKVFSLAQTVIQSLYPMGEVKFDRPIFEDPSRITGIRAYVPGDSLRRIHWKASLRHAGLQVKIFEPSTTLRAAIFLAVDSFQKEGIWDLKEMETGICAAASLANHILENKSQVGLFTNSQLVDTGQPARIASGTGSDQLLLILEGLAKVVNRYNQPFTDFFQEERGSLSQGTTLIFVFSQIPDKMGRIFLDLKERGYKIAVFQTGESGITERIPEVNFFQVSQLSEKDGLNLLAL
jgi:uncharacterized protein (DUF58 family)